MPYPTTSMKPMLVLAAAMALTALAAAAPTRMKIFDYAKTWENRRLVYAVIASEANLRRLDDHEQHAGANLACLWRPWE